MIKLVNKGTKQYVIITATLQYPYLSVPKAGKTLDNGTVIPPKYSVDLVLTEKDAAEAVKSSLPVKETEEGKSFVNTTCLESRKPIIVDEEKQPVTSIIDSGTIATVQSELINRSGKIYLNLQKIVVHNLVEFTVPELI